MNLDALLVYVNPIIVGACLCVGYVVKYAIPDDKINRFIPLIVAVLGVMCSIWYFQDFTLEVVLSGMLSGLVSTGLYEMFRNFIDKGGKENDI